MQETTVFETDWLGSTPVFYNERSGKASSRMNDVIDVTDIELDAEGFNNYLEYGYSVFGQTPLRNIKYLPHSTILKRKADGTLYTVTKQDVAETNLGKQSSEKNVFDVFERTMHRWEEKVSGDIIVPLSGGFDSRLLNYFIRDKSRVRSFTYGTSENQALSFEVINAKRLATNLKQSWEHIPLNNFLPKITEWENITSAATHAHGMYQMEFYEKIRAKIPNDGTVLSGIIGDAWAGSVNIPPINSVEDISSLGYSHGLHADATQSLLPSEKMLAQHYLDNHRDKLLDDRWRVLESMRFKMVLLSYLLTLPVHYDFSVWSPFIVPEVALSMLNLSSDRRRNRVWQRDFFASKKELHLEQHWCKDRKNTLNLQALQTQPVEPLDRTLLGEYVRAPYLDWINTTLAKAPQTLRLKKLIATPASLFYFFPGAHSLPGRLGIDPYTLKTEESRALNSYLTLHPIQNILKMRE